MQLKLNRQSKQRGELRAAGLREERKARRRQSVEIRQQQLQATEMTLECKGQTMHALLQKRFELLHTAAVQNN